MGSMLQQAPPNNSEAEMSFLGSMILNGDIDLIISIFDSGKARMEMFYRESNARIFNAMVELAKEGKPIDNVTIMERLDKQGLLEKCGGAAYIATCIEECPTPANWESYLNIIRETAGLRELIKAGQKLEMAGFEATEKDDALSISREHMKTIFQIMSDFTTKEAPSQICFGDCLSTLPVFNDDLDNLLGGIYRGEIMIITGDRATGKTSFTLDLTLSLAEDGYNVLLVNGKERIQMLGARLLCNKMGVSTKDFRKMSSKEDMERIRDMQKHIESLPIFPVCKTGGIPIAQLRDDIYSLRAKIGKIDVIIIDCLQNIDPDIKKASRSDQIEVLSREFTGIADSLNCAFIVVAELNKAGELADSKKLEYDPRQIVVIRGDGSFEDGPSDREFDIIKNEGGSGGKIKLPLYPYGSFIQK
jgi:replicative DNA helicase